MNLIIMTRRDSMIKKIDRRIFFTLLTALTISGFIIICTLGQSLHRQKAAAKLSAGVNEIAEPQRTVREYNGRIGVFIGDSTVPYRIIDYDVRLMPEFDREQLDQGIVIESEYELERLIEDIAH